MGLQEVGMHLMLGLFVLLVFALFHCLIVHSFLFWNSTLALPLSDSPK